MLEEKKASATSTTIGGVRERQNERKAAQHAEETAGAGSLHKTSGVGKKEKIGYVPRDKVNLQATGLTSAGMMNSR